MFEKGALHFVGQVDERVEALRHLGHPLDHQPVGRHCGRGGQRDLEDRAHDHLLDQFFAEVDRLVVEVVDPGDGLDLGNLGTTLKNF